LPPILNTEAKFRPIKKGSIQAETKIVKEKWQVIAATLNLL
jgi:hypothetical protein